MNINRLKEINVKKWLLKPPVSGDFLRLMQAWRVWVGGAVLGALVATAIFLVLPPPFRARATVLVDFNVEQAMPPNNSDRQVFFYLQRESDILIEIAWADSTLAPVSIKTGIPIADLRNNRLNLTQSGIGGWRFFADAKDPGLATTIASAWADSFYQAMQVKDPGISPFLRTSLTQSESLPVQRTVSIGIYIILGATIGAILLALLMLFFDQKEI